LRRKVVVHLSIDAMARLAEQTPAFFRALAEAAERGLTPEGNGRSTR
jgi:hypothetical protein